MNGLDLGASDLSALRRSSFRRPGLSILHGDINLPNLKSDVAISKVYNMNAEV